LNCDVNMASYTTTTTITTTPSLRLVAALLLSIYATLARAVYFTEPPSYWTQDTNETPVEDLARTYKIGDTVQLTWNVGTFVIPNISLSISQWTDMRENVDYLLVDVFNNMVYSWVIGEQDGLTDEAVEKQPNYILRLTDPSGTHATTNNPIGFKNDSLWSRAFVIKPSSWNGYVDSYSFPNATSSSSNSTLSGAPQQNDSGMPNLAVVVGSSIGCAVAGIAVGMLIVIKFGSRLFRRKDEDSEKAPASGPHSLETPSTASDGASTRMPSWSDKPYWVSRPLPIGGEAITRMALQRSITPVSSYGPSANNSPHRTSPAITVSPLVSHASQNASLAAAIYFPPYEPRLGDSDHPAEVAAWKLTPNTIYSSKMPNRDTAPMPPLDMLSLLTSPSSTMAMETRHNSARTLTGPEEEEELTISTNTVGTSQSGRSARSSVSLESDEIRGADRGRARWTGW
jgi:hypothetical protein